jgi:regulator of sirC expression with transglutaminase-like and TPR domain
VLNEYLFGELGFSGNIEQYTDPRNSFLNEVLDRRSGHSHYAGRGVRGGARAST